MPTGQSNTVLRLGTRGSLLAQRQSEWVARQIRQLHPQIQVELQIIKTTGDRIQDRPLHEAGGKGLFTKEIEQALLAGEIDFAVHSYKDVPVTMPLVDASSLMTAATPPREDARDVLISLDGIGRIIDLPVRSRVGTGSLRRQSQLLALRPDLQIVPIRGNIDSRLRKLRDGEFDAIILAAAGLKRAQLFDAALMMPIAVSDMVPSPGQGALAIQCRSADTETVAILQSLNDQTTQMCVMIERAVVRLLNADCHSPLGVYARVDLDQVHVLASLGGDDAKPPLKTAFATAHISEADTVANTVFRAVTEKHSPVAQ